MVKRRSVGAVGRVCAAAVLWPLVVWCAASVADPPPQPAEGSARGTECEKSGEGEAQTSEASSPTGSHPRLTEDNFTAWQTYLRANDAELAWKTIPWHLTFGDGIRSADAEGKPLLLWVMNGHPLGCT